MNMATPTPADRPLRALVVDDDEWALQLVRMLLEEACPELSVETRTTPDCGGDFEMYFLDNDFNGRKMAGELASAIRQRRPEALIVAFSATLDAPVLKQLINAGCNGACDKSRPEELEELARIAAGYAGALRAARHDSRNDGRGLLGAIRSIRDLLHEWNTRLETPRSLQESRS